MQNLWKANWLNESRAIKIPIIFDSEIPFLGLDPKAIAPKTEEKKKMFAMVLFIKAKTKQQKWKQPICPFVGKEKNLLGEPSGSMPLMTSTWPHGGILSQGWKWQLHRKLCRLDFQSPHKMTGTVDLKKKKTYWNKIDKKHIYACDWVMGLDFFPSFFPVFFFFLPRVFKGVFHF